jgi:hypothetical protein
MALETRRYKYVIWHKSQCHSNGGWWTASVTENGQSTHIGGRFSDQHSAAKAAAEYLHLDVQQLKLSRPTQKLSGSYSGLSRYQHVCPDKTNENFKALLNGCHLGTRKTDVEAAQLVWISATVM